MSKDTFYFSHDYNSRNDEKIKFLLRKHGFNGYGLFWAIIEDLYNNANALRTDYEGIAYDFRVDVSLIESIIKDFDLFVFEGDTFGSLSVQKRIDERDSKSVKARESAHKRWTNANAMQSQCEGNAIKESKGKEIKEKKVIKGKVLPILFRDSIYNDIEVFSASFLGTQYEGANFNFYYEKVKNWSDSKNNKKVDWIATAKNWMADDMANNKFIDINFNPNAKRTNPNQQLSYAEREAQKRNSL
jgi:hypothetical protein